MARHLGWLVEKTNPEESDEKNIKIRELSFFSSRGGGGLVETGRI